MNELLTSSVCRNISNLKDRAVELTLWLPVMLKEDKKPMLALIDSGSEVNIIGDVWIDPRNLDTSYVKLPITAINGGQLEILGLVNLSISLKRGRSMEVAMFVVKNSRICVLGRPFLVENRVIVYHEDQSLDMHDEKYALVRRNPLCWSNSVQMNFREGFSLEHIPKTTAEKLQRILWTYSKVWEGERIGRTSIVEHEINLTTPRAICCGNRKYSLEQQVLIDREVESMLQKGIIRESHSPFASGVVLVKKKDNSCRFCVDYRPLNAVTVHDSHPLPRIKDLLSSIKESKFFISLDLRAGYWQIKMRTEDIPKTAFRTHRGLYEFVVMPFGLVNAPLTFQRFMENLFGDLRWRGVLAYLDDILIHSKTVDEALKLLETVLARLAESNLTVKLAKCSFFPSELDYLGHVITSDGIKPNANRVQALHKLGPPSDISGLRRVLGLFGYYREYIPRYAELVEPLLTNLRGKKALLEWGEEQQKALVSLKEALADRILKIPVDDDVFLLETDASGFATAAILSIVKNDGAFPIEFASNTLSEAERRWPIREQEAYAIVWALKRFDGYLRGRKVTVHTDHQSLKWLLEAKNGKLARWASKLQEYDLEVFYKKGIDLIHVDTLTRNPEEAEEVEERMVYSTRASCLDLSLPLLDEIKLRTEVESTVLEKGVERREGFLWYRGCIYPQASFRDIIIDYFHSSRASGHPGVVRTLKKISLNFKWPKMDEDVRGYIKSCLLCGQFKPGRERQQGLWKAHDNPIPFRVLHIDFWGPIMPEEQKLWVLTMIDVATRWPEAVLIQDKKASTVANKLIEAWITRFGVPDLIISDQDPSFMDESLTELLEKIGSKPYHSTVYHPEGNAPVESFHRHIKKTISILLRQAPNLSLGEVLQFALFAYRTTPHLSLNETPAFLLYGLDPSLPQDQHWNETVHGISAERLQLMKKVRENLIKRAVELNERNRERQNQRRIDTKFKENDLILIRDSRNSTGESNKLRPYFSLPYRIIRIDDGGKTAEARSLLDGKTTQVHIQNARFIDEPKTDFQQEIWNHHIGEEMSD